MILPPIIRIFFAIEIPATSRDKISELISTYKRALKTNAIRWSKPENLHITLQFLANVSKDDLPKLIENVSQSLCSTQHLLHVQIGSMQLFPNPFRPRVIVLDVKAQEDLSAVANIIGQGIKISGYEIEARPFRAHLTLGRIKRHENVKLTSLQAIQSKTDIALAVDKVVLYRSEPQETGSIYTELAVFPLTNTTLATMA